jgi:hypothetical protein
MPKAMATAMRPTRKMVMNAFAVAMWIELT